MIAMILLIVFMVIAVAAFETIMRCSFTGEQEPVDVQRVE